MKIESPEILTVETIEQLLRCRKYQRVRFRNAPKGESEVYVGNISKASCSCCHASMTERPITLMKQKDGMIILKEILILNPKSKFNYIANVQEIRPADSDYQSISSELNKGVTA